MPTGTPVGDVDVAASVVTGIPVAPAKQVAGTSSTVRVQMVTSGGLAATREAAAAISTRLVIVPLVDSAAVGRRLLQTLVVRNFPTCEVV
eukprot:2859940-Pyramimonas_sp.AAC.1